MAQLMRFWQHPTVGVGTASFQIKVDGAPTTRSLRGGDGAGGPYNWASMPLTTSSKTPSTQCQAIGALTADAGVSENMNYWESGSSAWAYGSAFTNTFGYGNAMDAYNDGNNFPETNLYAIVNPNLDARHPVILDIMEPSGEGHAVVCDGYGYNSSTLYHHLNMGWLGEDNAWYNLPNIETTYYDFNSVYGATYNIFVTGAGEIISGRVTDSNGNPVSGASVTGTLTAGGTYSATTDANGIYALFPVPSSSSYNVSVAKGGYGFPTTQAATGTSADMTVTTGNQWGINFSGSATASHFSVSAPSSASTGTAFNFTVTALDADNNIVTSYSGTVHFTSSDTAAALPANSTLTGGTGTFSATFNTAGSQTITATDTGDASIAGTSSAIKVSKGKTYSISGTVRTKTGKPFSGVLMNLSNGLTTTTNSTGKYQFSNLPSGTYTVIPTKQGYSFQPSSTKVPITKANLTNENFKAQ